MYGPCFIRGTEWCIENDASRKISAQSRNLGILNKNLGISCSLHVEQSQVSNFYNLKSFYRPARLLLCANVYSLPLEFGSHEYIFERFTSFVRDYKFTIYVCIPG